jgi:hypothetical protein
VRVVYWVFGKLESSAVEEGNARTLLTIDRWRDFCFLTVLMLWWKGSYQQSPIPWLVGSPLSGGGAPQRGK